jgi:hypothetical protein
MCERHREGGSGVLEVAMATASPKTDPAAEEALVL